MKKKQRQRIKKASKLLVSALMVGAIFATPAFADDVLVSTWDGLRAAIIGPANPINVYENITRGASDEDITISRTLSIIGTETGKYLDGGYVAATPESGYKGLTVGSGGNLTLQNITMQNFKNTGNGGAIYNEDGKITGITGDFKGNHATSGSGGAIYNFKHNVNTEITSISGKFSGNSAQGGGAIYNISGGEIGNISGDFEDNFATDTYGGAINNFNSSSKIGIITGNFKRNHADGTSSLGGAIYNSGIIDSITGNFENNYTASTTYGGGAIANTKTINISTSDEKSTILFTGNYITNSSGKGGAISNMAGTLGLYAKGVNDTITFVGGENDTTNNKYNIDGIYNQATLNINGFKDESGAITKYDGTVNLYTVSDAATAKGTTNIYGGTVSAVKDITQKNLNIKDNVTLDLAKNKINTVNVTDLSIADGVKLRFDVDGSNATQNSDRIIANTITANIINIDSINMMSGFTGDSGSITLFAGEGASSLAGKIADTKTYYNGNLYTFTQDDTEYGKLNVAGTPVSWTIQDVIGAQTFADTEHTILVKDINTYSMSDDENLTAVLGTLTRYPDTDSRSLTINGNGHVLNGQNTVAGITVNSGDTLTLNNVNMENFKKEGETPDGGAIYNNGTITSITGNFSHNSADEGGAIYNNGTITSITGNFINNNALSKGGAIYNKGTVTIKTADDDILFESNYAINEGGAILNGANAETNIIAGGGNITFKDNYANGNGGAIFNAANAITNIIADGSNITFDGNYVTAENVLGGAIYNVNNTVGLYAVGENDSITFLGEDNTTQDLPDNANDVDGIYNTGTLNINGYVPDPASPDDYTSYLGTVELQDVTSDNELAPTKGITNIYGGKVESNGDFIQKELNISPNATLNADAGNLIITDGINNNGTLNLKGGDSLEETEVLVSAISGAGTTNIKSGIVNATKDITQNNINVLSGATLNSEGNIEVTTLTNNGTVTTSGVIEAAIQNNANGSVTINGDTVKLIQLTNSGTANINGKLNASGSNIQLTQNGGIMNFSTNAIESTENLPINIFTMNGGSVNIADGSVNTLHINQLNLAGNTNFAMDADLAARNMDKIKVNNATITEGKVININKINLLSDATQEKINLSIFADDATKDALINHVNANINGLQYSPIYKYDALYNPETGMIGFTRYKNGGYDDLNPAVMAGAVAAQVGGYLNQLTSYDNAFEHMDTYMLMTKDQRTAMKMLNKYASAGANLGTYNPNQLADESKGIWFKPYATFEKVNLKGGPNVENTAYGSFVGGDSDLIELKNGWDMMYSAYASYDGSHQNYDGVSVYQNGGHLGGTATWYKGNFFTGLTANVGASVAEASTMYGTDNMTMLMAGVASKTGYNWELLNSKLIVQPSLLMSYSFVNMFDYTNKAGVAIDSDPLHAIQIAPGLKFIGNLPHGWQPYVGVQMVWNIMDETKFTAANVNLPQLSTRPYFQYGIGVQKKWGDRFSGYLQAMLRNGGRTGIALSAGFRWALGKDVTNGNLKQTNNSVPELPKTKIILSSASK